MNFDKVILVDEGDRELGTLDKLVAHEEGRLHRAFSIFIFNSQRELLLQRRAMGKYHSGGLWTNTCCSHPQPGYSSVKAAEKRLFEEMGLVADLNFAFKFTYKVPFENGLTEHELDYVYIGYSDMAPVPNEEEVMEWRYASLRQVEDELASDPEYFTSWFKLCFEKVQTLVK